MVAILVLLPATNAANAQRDAADQIAAIQARLGGRIGVAGLDTGSGKRIDYRAEERFPLCSTFKFLAAAAVLKRVDEKKDKLDRFVSYDAKDILEYAPVTKAHLGMAECRSARCVRRQSNKAITRPAIYCWRQSADRLA
jgi:beta-lactamase class A